MNRVLLLLLCYCYCYCYCYNINSISSRSSRSSSSRSGSSSSSSRYDIINSNKIYDVSRFYSHYSRHSSTTMSITASGKGMLQPSIPSSITSSPSSSSSILPTSSIGFNQNENIDSSQIGPVVVGVDATIKKDIAVLKNRLEKLEKEQLRLSLGQTQKSTVTTFIDSLAASTLAMNARTVELCAIVGFFWIGVLVGASLLDRLWLLGGIGAAWWASGAVHRDTRGGNLARRVGVQLAQLIRDIQEKLNQAIIFYRTGKLGYVSWRWWDQYDTKFGVTRKVDEFKRLAMVRYAEFNTQLGGYHWTDQVSDLWKAMQAAPAEAQKINNRYGLTNRVGNFGKKIVSAGITGVKGTISLGKELFRDPEEMRRTYLGYEGYGQGKSYSFSSYSRNKRRNVPSNSYSFDISSFFGSSRNNNKKGNGGIADFFRSITGNNKKTFRYRSRLINPWSLPKLSSNKKR